MPLLTVEKLLGRVLDTFSPLYQSALLLKDVHQLQFDVEGLRSGQQALVMLLIALEVDTLLFVVAQQNNDLALPEIDVTQFLFELVYLLRLNEQFL